MLSSQLIEQWKKDESAAFEGWNFSYLRNRWIEEKPPWDYQAIAKELVQRSQGVLDMGTGGGEVFSSLAPFPKQAAALEGYKPNVEIARRRLKSLGVTVIEADGSGSLPFADGAFDLILNRHSAFQAPEVFRILRSGGTFLTQQVGGGNLNDLIAAFDATPKFKSWTLEKIRGEVENAGFAIREAKDWKGTVEFKDVGAIVYFLKAIPWVVEGFRVEKHVQYLMKLQQKLENGQKFLFTEVRFFVWARK